MSVRLEGDRQNKELGLESPEGGDDETLAGFLLHLAMTIPRCTAIIRYGDIIITLERGTLHACQEVPVRWSWGWPERSR